jgi:plastocyanin
MRALWAAILVGALLILAACGKSTPAAPAPANSALVDIKNIAFNPNKVTVKVGQTIAWKFDDGTIAHNVTFSSFASNDQTSGYYTHTFNTAGTFQYRCTIHSDMDGTVVVTP